MKKIKKLSFSTLKNLTLSAILLAFVHFNGIANNVKITNVVNTNAGQAYPIITFDIAWDNSWKQVSSDIKNWDAVWIFVKYQKVIHDAPNCESNLEWSHATTYYSGQSASSPLSISRDTYGYYLYRTSDGIGNIPPTSVTIKLNLPIPSGMFAEEYNFKIFAIEMVHIPTGDYALGDGVSDNSFNNTLVISSSGPTNIGGNTSAPTGSARITNGYNSFYCMKYEVSQQQYVDFLNTLTFTQQLTRTALNSTQLTTDPGSNGLCAMTPNCENRNSVKLIKEGVNSTIPAVFACDLNDDGNFDQNDDGQTLAMNYLSADDLFAYLDWAVLRPMTNLEFEKVARGNNSSISGEYVWSSTNITQASSASITNPGEVSEQSTASGNGLAAYNNASGGPLRTGFAATSSTNRQTSGSAFYGVMDLSGNVYETVRGGFYTTHSYSTTSPAVGNGALDVNGNSNASYTNASYSTADYIENRGGSFASPADRLRASDRYYTKSSRNPLNYSNNRHKECGGRGVR